MRQRVRRFDKHTGTNTLGHAGPARAPVILARVKRYTMPKTCCRCNASGRCTNCSCKKANRVCVNCLPFRQGHCNNPPKPDTTEAAEQGSEQHTAVPRSETQDQASLRDGGNGPVLMATPTPSENLTPQADTSPTSNQEHGTTAHWSCSHGKPRQSEPGTTTTTPTRVHASSTPNLQMG